MQVMKIQEIRRRGSADKERAREFDTARENTSPGEMTKSPLLATRPGMTMRGMALRSRHPSVKTEFLLIREQKNNVDDSC